MINKTFRLFISSTFSDFVEERTILNDEVFHEIEYLRDSTPLRSFLREKNDLFSEAVESENGNYVVLVSQMLSSIIVFDVTRMEVFDAYKHFGSIIGCRFANDGVLEIISDREPQRTKIKIN